ncbi:MAG: hypothetical protein ACRDPB_03225 [Nocardioidaceae bacterium]
MLALLVAVPMVLVGATAGPASAHVLKTVGPYHLLIGFGDEPTFAGSQNSVFLLLTNAKTGAPIVDESLGDTLKVEVRFGTRHMQLPLVSSYDPDSGGGTKGVYNAYFIPTVPGDYTFHLYGTIDKQKVDVSVKSSSTTFDSAHDPATIQFPQRAPSNVQLAQRLKAESARMSARTHAASKESGSASTSAALAVGIAGLVVGAAGLCVGGLALTRSRSRRPAAGEPQSPRVE